MQANNESNIPAPQEHTDNKAFWQGIKNNELLIQKCSKCGKLMHPPMPMCPGCHSLDRGWIKSTGKGTVYSWVVYHEAPSPCFKTPYSVALIELEEDIRIVSNLIDIQPGDIKVGMPVEVVFKKVDENVVLPVFKKAG